MKEYSSLVIREIQIKTRRCYLTLTIITSNKKTIQCCPGCREMRPLIYCWWECKMVQLL